MFVRAFVYVSCPSYRAVSVPSFGKKSQQRDNTPKTQGKIFIIDSLLGSGDKNNCIWRTYKCRDEIAGENQLQWSNTPK
ncbi:MAG: hypothetical protein JXQ81_09330, partial [Desulfuromonadales bacterium]|nr:hypothetical protein [Desulfuromonadales bacterium]